jgi:hypothetical protein
VFVLFRQPHFRVYLLVPGLRVGAGGEEQLRDRGVGEIDCGRVLQGGSCRTVTEVNRPIPPIPGEAELAARRLRRRGHEFADGVDDAMK